MTTPTGTVWHSGRAWSGHEIEDACPCDQEPCGLVNLARAHPGCEHHPFARCKSMRQGHRAQDCPGGGTMPADTEPRTVDVDQHTTGSRANVAGRHDGAEAIARMV